jgi:uncharacterized membrane protein YkvA (DUF1232 family)
MTIWDGVRRAWSFGGSTLLLLARLATDRRVDVRRRVAAGLAVLYAISPVDLIPDGVPLLGRVDDAAVAMAAVKALVDGAGDDLLAEHWDGEPGDLEALRGALDAAAGLVPRRLRWLRSALLPAEPAP